MPSAYSTEFVPELASRPVDRRAVEPTRKTMSTSGRHGEEEDEEVMVSCEDL